MTSLSRRAGDAFWTGRRVAARGGVQSARASRKLSAVAWLGHRDSSSIQASLTCRLRSDGTERALRLAGRRWRNRGGRTAQPTSRRAFRSGRHGGLPWLGEQQRKTRGAVVVKRTSEARTLAGLQFKLNPSGWGNPALVSHLSGEATNPIAILLQRCLARIWPSLWA
jgi:hypothetical protein